MNALGGDTGTGRNVASGRPVEAVRREVKIKDAITGYLESLRKHKEPIPPTITPT